MGTREIAETEIGGCHAPRKGAVAEQHWLTEFELSHGGVPWNRDWKSSREMAQAKQRMRSRNRPHRLVKPTNSIYLSFFD
jgi:hypothetical protein